MNVGKLHGYSSLNMTIDVIPQLKWIVQSFHTCKYRNSCGVHFLQSNEAMRACEHSGTFGIIRPDFLFL